ncbi:unnamed protein product [Rotaria sp. Silwood1]|nr:unnamed protein product [Rotaria sp. Silwood1]
MITLPKVKEFDFYTKGDDGLDAMTLLVWLLLAPNVIRLELAQINKNHLIQFIEQANELYETDERVRPIFGRLVQVYSLPIRLQIDDTTAQYLFELLRKIFPKAFTGISKKRTFNG